MEQEGVVGIRNVGHAQILQQTLGVSVVVGLRFEESPVQLGSIHIEMHLAVNSSQLPISLMEHDPFMDDSPIFTFEQQ
jgi:hypothetical protein